MDRVAAPRRSFKIALLGAVAACVLAAPAPGTAATSTSTSTALTITHANTLEGAVTYRINRVRAARGLRKLRTNSRLTTAATVHATSMGTLGYFSHDLNGVGFGTWIKLYYPGPGYTSWQAGENLYWAAPSPTARAVVRAWMNSTSHRQNLLRSSWRQVGLSAVTVRNPLGVYAGTGTVTIVVAEFGRRS